MYLYDLLILITSAFTGSAMGSFLMLSVVYNSLVKPLPHDQQQLVYRRFHRLNSALCLLGGLMAALLKNQQAALILAVIAVSYVFANMHILRGIDSHAGSTSVQDQRTLELLIKARNLIHLVQFLACGYVIYLLSSSTNLS